MIQVGKWRRFLPRQVRRAPALSSDVFDRVRAIVDEVDAIDFVSLDAFITKQRKYMDQADVAQWIALLVMQAPRAAHAQSIMDEYPHGYHDREKRLYELIDFNDTLVSAVLLLPEKELPTLPTLLKVELDVFCKKMYSREFDTEQFDAIIHGLSREIAVFKAAENAGMRVLMTSRVADAFGIDMQIADSATGNYINIDCKTGSSFHFRLKRLVRNHRMKYDDIIEAETKGWWETVNKGKNKRVKVILLRISQDELGEIRNFRFANEQAIVEKLKLIIEQRSLSDDNFGWDFAGIK